MSDCACGGKTTPCFVVYHGKTGLDHSLAAHGAKKNMLGMSNHTSEIKAQVCVQCGNVSLTATNATIFADEVAG